jgi:predicted HTH domain antitoxin
MTTETVSFEISQDILASLKVGTAELEQDMRLLAAINYFQEKKLSLGKAAQLSGHESSSVHGCSSGERRRDV